MEEDTGTIRFTTSGRSWFVSYVHADDTNFGVGWVTVDVKAGTANGMTKKALTEISETLERMYPHETVALLSFQELAD